MNKKEVAMNYFKSGYNCAQAVVAAFCDKIDMPEKQAIKLASSFGGGMGRMREVCGAMSGIAIVVGLLYGYDDASEIAEKSEHYALIQRLAEEFKQVNGGSIICRELLDDKSKISALPSERNAEYYKKRPCVEIVGNAAEILENYIREREGKTPNNC